MKINPGKILSCGFGILVLLIGIINTFWGNDPFFGLFLIFLSFAYYPAVTDHFKRITNIPIPFYIKIILAIFILWASLGVGELFDKIDLMLMDL